MLREGRGSAYTGQGLRLGDCSFEECEPEADLENGQSSWHYAAHTLEPGLKPNPHSISNLHST